jgi:murein tripeptide amidase MpaA
MPTIDYSRFHRHAELLALLQAWAVERPDLIDLGELGSSHEGRTIPLVTLTRKATGPAADKPAYWVDGNIHSVELSGCSACLYFIDWLLRNDGHDPEVTRALDTLTFYVCPRLNPDGAEWALADRPRHVRSSTRRYPVDEDPVDGLLVQDIDGDGRILQMRVADPNGPWKAHPLEPQLLIRRDPADPPGGDYFRVMPEGLIENYDGVRIQLAGTAGSPNNLDLNRNFPSGWRQEFEQAGAGPYPTSEPEVRAVVQFFIDHPNICGGTSIHTFSGVLLRPLGHASDDALPPEDLWTYQTLGRKGESLTGYPAVSVWHEFQYYPKEYISGTFDWIYEHLGLYTWTVEIWNPRKEAGIESREWIHWFRDHPPEDDLKLFRWAQQVAPDDGHVPWRPFDHPQLGRVEIGGWHRMRIFSNPPPALREKEIARFPPWLLWMSLLSPLLALRSAEAHPVGDGTWRVRLVVQNTGWLPTSVSRMAVRRKLLRGVLAELALPPGATLVSGKARQEIGELQGWSDLHTGVSFWPQKEITADLGVAEWVVRAPAGARIDLTARHDRAGRVAATIVLESPVRQR